MLDSAMKNFGKNSGLTLIELMVAVLLFVIVMSGIGYMVHMVVPSQRAYKMNALTNDLYKVSYLFKKDLGNAVKMPTPSLLTQIGSPVQSLKLKLSGSASDLYVEYRLHTTGARTTLERCEMNYVSNPVCTSFEDLLSSWDDGYIAVPGTGNNYFSITRGLDADSSGALSSTEKNMVIIVMSMGAYEGAKNDQKRLVDTRTLVLEFLLFYNGEEEN